MKKVMVAMSGGVDSAVAAYLLQKEGYACTGVTMKLFAKEAPEKGCCAGEAAKEVPEKGCCAAKAARDAEKAARRLGIPFYEVDLREDFCKEVIERFVNGYLAGETPNPCVDCNRYIKFEKLLARMGEQDCDYVATGHYARIAYDGERGRYLLRKGLDESKDQSYVLFHLTQEQLSHILFPLGEYRKTEIRELAGQNALVDADKRESQDICFVPDGNYGDFIEKYCDKTFPEGDFVGEDGRVLGRHKGIVRYTIGQRKGLGIAFGEPLYVCGKDTKTNTILLSDNEKLFGRELEAEDLNWIAVQDIDTPLRCKAKIRYRQKEADALVERAGEDRVKVTFDVPQRGITCGQAVVFYDGDVVLGGGTICGGTD